MNNSNTLGYIATFFVGAGATEFQVDFNRALICFGIAVVLIITTAVLNKKGIPVTKSQ